MGDGKGPIVAVFNVSKETTTNDVLVQVFWYNQDSKTMNLVANLSHVKPEDETDHESIELVEGMEAVQRSQLAVELLNETMLFVIFSPVTGGV